MKISLNFNEIIAWKAYSISIEKVLFTEIFTGRRCVRLLHSARILANLTIDKNCSPLQKRIHSFHFFRIRVPQFSANYESLHAYFSQYTYRQVKFVWILFEGSLVFVQLNFKYFARLQCFELLRPKIYKIYFGGDQPRLNLKSTSGK